MLKIFDECYRQANGEDNFYPIARIAVNVDHIISVELDDVYTDEDEKEVQTQTIIRMNNGDQITSLLPIDDVLRILCGAKI